jgi:hypothetical protein
LPLSNLQFPLGGYLPGQVSNQSDLQTESNTTPHLGNQILIAFHRPRAATLGVRVVGKALLGLFRFQAFLPKDGKRCFCASLVSSTKAS